MMRWQKLGRVFAADNNRPWMRSHASNTVAERTPDGFFRISFSTRDEQNRSHIGCLDAALGAPPRVLRVADSPVLAPGDVGLFDDSGVSLSSILNIGGISHLFYLGWNLGVTVPWRNSIGLALWNPETQRYQRFSQAPLLDRCDVDPYSISYPFVLEDNDRYRMWYGSNLSWGKEQRDMAHVIKYAESRDGRTWIREGRIALGFKNEHEYAMSRPCVIHENGLYRMWYSYRGDRYRIGYAESRDGLAWDRKDELAGLDTSDSGWDSEMVCYPFLFDHDGERYMLYNGNSYGRTGFGLARLIQDL